MEFGFTEHQEKLRKEIREFFSSELPEDYEPDTENMGKEVQAFMMQLKDKAVKKGYYVPGWPKEYGGAGYTEIDQGILDEEMGYAGVLWPDFLGLHLVGPTLMMIGTEEQKKRFIPPIARGETVCFEAFTEPEAGSDEANVQLKAVEDGDSFVLSGQKVFISGAFEPNWLFTLARTTQTVPKHRGLTLFLVPANLPGITFRPLPTMGGGRQNEIYFDEVRVSKEYLLGEINRGFYHAMMVFEFERRMTGAASRGKRQLEELIAFCKETKRDGKPLMEDPHVRDTLAGLAIQCEVQRLAGWHSTWAFAERDEIGPMPYDLSNYYAKKWAAPHAKAMTDIIGLYAQLRTGSKWVPMMGRLERMWKVTRSMHAGGTFEVIKIVLAQRGLGLPRIPAQLMTAAGEAIKKGSKSA
ncbi:MAG: acyl-CoA dehydrogenase family protein [Deltaproteobacteria bacterium]|nr:acyl-CoA dehydrogenase family protein [Deltaproteobacteria bacterium]